MPEVSTEFLRPIELYSKLSTARLITGFYLENRLFEMQAYFMLLHRASLALPVSFPEWQLKSRELELTDLEPLYNRCRDDLLVQLMVMLKIKWRWMLVELHKRFDPLGMDVLMEKWEDVERVWIQERRLKFTFDDKSDVSQQGMLKGLELLEQAGKSSLEEDAHRPFLELRRPLFPLPLDELERKAWDALLEEFWSSSLHAAFGKVVPLLRGDAKSIGNSVDNFLRENPRKIQRRRNIIEGREKFPKRGPESWRAEWDFSKSAADARHKEIQSNIHAASPDILADKKLDVFSKAKKRWGQPAAKAFKALLEGKTEEEAASIAGITSNTLAKYKKKLAKDFSKEN